MDDWERERKLKRILIWLGLLLCLAVVIMPRAQFFAVLALVTVWVNFMVILELGHAWRLNRERPLWYLFGGGLVVGMTLVELGIIIVVV